ncbi:MAG: helix-turn-helix transcriptional regulator [Spirochaetales bacterium]|nr:helix-turn-helix transcriptional regulator [Spirochaetales bacterium]
MNKKEFRSVEIDDLTFDFQLLPQFINIGQIKTSKPWGFESHVHNNHEWLLNRKGKVRCWIDGYEFTARRGTFYFIQPGQSHKQISEAGETDHCSVRFHLYNAAKQEIYLFQPPGNPQRQVLQDRNGQLTDYIERIYKEVWKQRQGWKQIAEAIIIEMIWYVRRKLDIFPANIESSNISIHHRNIVNQAKRYLQSNLNHQVGLEELSNYCCTSYYHIGRIFKNITNMTPLQYTHSLRIAKAQHLLVKSDMTIYNIANSVGFQDAAFFTRQFKKTVGVTPKDYRLRCFPEILIQEKSVEQNQ